MSETTTSTNPDTLPRRWVEALRSGEYQQGQGRLRDGDSFCCLGVLCDLIDPNGWDSFRYWHYDGDVFQGMPPLDIHNRYHRYGLDFERLATLNDSGKPFEEIADYIEDNIAGGI